MELGLCVEMVFADLPFEERLEKAAAAGLKNVEMWLVDRSWQAGPDALARVAERCGVRITNTVVGSPEMWNCSSANLLTSTVHRAEFFYPVVAVTSRWIVLRQGKDESDTGLETQVVEMIGNQFNLRST